MVIQFLTENPELALVLGLLLRGVLAWQRELSWYEYRTLHGLKRLAFPALQRVVPLYPLVTEKGGRDDAEYLSTEEDTVRAVVRRLRAGGGSLHLVSALKRRPAANGDPLTRAHLVWTGGGKQTEAYLFQNDDGTVDVYAHREDSVTDPAEHLDGSNQEDGDPEGVVAKAL